MSRVQAVIFVVCFIIILFPSPFCATAGTILFCSLSVNVNYSPSVFPCFNTHAQAMCIDIRPCDLCLLLLTSLINKPAFVVQINHKVCTLTEPRSVPRPIEVFPHTPQTVYDIYLSNARVLFYRLPVGPLPLASTCHLLELYTVKESNAKAYFCHD